ncbi:hypothetical protein BH11ACT5_BH11ACT5_02910 [soil metagenome]
MTQPMISMTPRPPLTSREKFGARLAGAVSFLLLTLGWALFSLPIALVVFGAFFALLFAGIQRAAGDDGPLGVLQGFDASVWILPLLLSVLVGAVLVVASLFVSRGILRANGITKPWVVTFAGAGISVVASWIVSAILAIPLQLIGAFSAGDSSTPTIIAGIIALVLGVVITAAIGWLSWWWMAHVTRPLVKGTF